MTIITLTLNPAFDVHCHVRDFKPYRENLATVISRDAGGKGVNISRALTKNGVDNTALVVLGEENAADFQRALAADGMTWREITVSGRIRENITVHTDTAEETRISFAGFETDTNLLERVRESLAEIDLSQCVLTLTGRIPDGLPMDDIKRFLVELHAHGTRIVIDSKSFSLDDLIECRPWLIKPNEDEIADYIGRENCTVAELTDTARGLYRAGVENVMISLGGKGAMLVCAEGLFVATPPTVEPLSTIGAGDSSIAGFLAAKKMGKDAAECLRTAVAYGTAACLTVGTKPPCAEDVTRILKEIRCFAYT
ncbi:MAG: 1-phosphofructokinase family hexose kinase [Clostridia bacterium]|nr:1-phosphofructokinase family hexose kinase [Clostridia bacterium]